MDYIVNTLINKNMTISVMESCTGGFISSSITNIPGASEIFKFGAVTYSNEYKIKLGVDENTINTYSVYSTEVSMSMSYNISKYTNSNYGIGITGKLNRIDKSNLYGDDNKVYISIYDKLNNKYINDSLYVNSNDRLTNKEEVLKKLINMLKEVL